MNSVRKRFVLFAMVMGFVGAIGDRGRQRALPREGHTRAVSRYVALALALVMALGLLPGTATTPAQAAVGQGFNLNPSDLRFILRQIKIAEQHADTATASNPCGTLLGPGQFQIPNIGQGVELPWGLRTVDGSCNNLIPNQQSFGTADQPFPRLVPKSLRAAEFNPFSGAPTSYAQTAGSVFDSQPRIISNLISDQTPQNPAAEAAAGIGAEVTPSGDFMIPNVAPDVGLSAPYNSWFTLFGQFFDHGLDLVNKGGNGTVFVPLQADDPLFKSGSPNFMLLSRATHSGNHEATNQTSPFVDQSQTYSSHPSHQVFLREYTMNSEGKPVSTGKLITAGVGGMATWADVKAQAATMLGINLVDTDVLRIPLLATDPYGKFVPGPNGFPQIVTSGPDGIPGNGDDVLVEGNPTTPVSTTGAIATGHAFLDDIAHHAVPGGGRTPDADPGTTDDGIASTYDDEMLEAHFMAGDGRVNENIGLVAVHHIFHSEHNRLVGDIKSVIQSEDPTQLDQWQLTPGTWNGERLFQAARFVTENEYQHLAFEEFARKVQPMVNPFGGGGTGYHTTINPAIRAEFAHAVYRFGHSMLTESVDRVGFGTSNISLMDAFLNPPEFTMNGTLTPDQAAGSIVRGMTRQVGNELDEFVVEALRNQLLGLPLDLATLNLARARETGTPTLNEARRSFYAASSDSALLPYESWADFSFSLKHQASLVNFVAAYGTHPTILAATTADAKRATAELLVAADALNPDTPADAFAFMNGLPHTQPDPDTAAPTLVHTDWVSGANGVTTTGLDRVDLWVGGLAEKQMVFGGLLGPTFNYVFEAQMEDLQDGDRFYYLSRAAGLNLLTQLEGNSFAELISRNSDSGTLPADSFSRPDFIFDVEKLGTSGPILDDPDTFYNETALLIRMPDGTIRYAGAAHVVFNGSAGNDRMRASEGDDTLRGNDGNDRLEGGDGADNLIGGFGDDILTDLFGDDTLKGGDGNDVLSSGKGFGGDLNQGGRGNDYIIGGNDATESFAGPGNDFVFAGLGDDTVFGDDGDDWIEGGGGAFNLLQGDNGAPFQDDLNAPGHDVIMGFGGENDYDAEGGDDIMLAGPGIQRNEGMLGFDWVTHKDDPAAGDSDMRFTGLLPPTVQNNRDRFDLVESLSGWVRADILRGDDRDALAMIGHELNAEGIARISGLANLLPSGATSFTGGNILIGGAGGDLIEGRGGDDIIDGDAWLNVQIIQVDASGAELRRVDRMSALNALMLSGTINPGSLRIVREIIVADGASDIDVAMFSGPLSDYDIEVVEGAVIVTHARGTAVDGSDRVRNVEVLRFSDRDVLTSGLAPLAELNLTALGFGSQTTGVSSPEQLITITNTGVGNLVVTSVASGSAAFAVSSNTCATVGAGAICTVGVVFTPVAVGLAEGWITITHNAVGSPSVVAVSGTGVPTFPLAELSAASLAFGNQSVGSASATQSITITNTGTANLVVTNVTVGGTNPAEFSAAATGCGDVAPAATCTIDVAFRPTTQGAKGAEVSIVHNAAVSPSVVTLSGSGVVVALPTLAVPAAVDFGTRRVGTIRSQNVRITNQGPGAILITGLVVDGPFTATLGNCPASLAAGRSCTLRVTFTPTAIGPVTRLLTVISNAAGSPQTALTGTGR